MGCRIQRRAHFPDARNGRGVQEGSRCQVSSRPEAPASQGHALPSLSLRLPKGDRLEVGLAGLGSVWGAPHWRSQACQVNLGDSSSWARDESAVITATYWAADVDLS